MTFTVSIKKLDGGIPHGRGMYVNHGCRCSVCTKANAEYQRTYMAKYRGVTKAKKIRVRAKSDAAKRLGR